MSKLLSDQDWKVLVSRIKEGKCTPFLGAGACYGILPLGKDIALEWAKNHKYPLEDIDDLGSVSQFLAITHDPLFPKEEMSRLLKKVSPTEFSAIEKSHGLLASLPLPVYLTTNYDDFLYQTLRSKGKEPVRAICQWNGFLQEETSFVLEKGFKPNIMSPLIFHLHGLSEMPDSMVLTEDDYVDFLVNISKHQSEVIPNLIQRALTGSSLLFVGYSLRDWSFRVIFRGLISQLDPSMRRISVAVQLTKDDELQEEYLEKYFNKMNIKIFWGTAEEFIEELEQKIDEFE